MPALTKTQIEHATKRLDEQKNAYITRMLKPLGPRPPAMEFTTEEKTAMIRSGVAKLRPDYDADSVCYSRRIGDFFDYPLTDAQKAASAAVEAWDAQAQAIRDAASAIYEGMIDELIMSPDGKSALDRIAAAFA